MTRNKTPLDKEYLLNESTVFCILPWVHVNVSVDGGLRPCCIIKDPDRLSWISDYQTLIEHMNSPKVQDMRKRMLNDEQISCCSICYDQESINTSSFRKIMNYRWQYLINVVDRTNTTTGYLNDPEIHHLDYTTSNFCNLKCVMCNVYNSSALYHDHRMLADDKDLIPTKIITPMSDKNKMIKSIIDESPTIEEMHFVGGEPLIMPEHYLLLQQMINADATRLKLSYNTNFTKLKHRGTHIFDLWEKFDELNIGISLDDYGERGEYIRKGSVWSTIEDNLRLLNTHEFKSLEVTIHMVVCILNIWNLTDFHKYLVDNNFMEINKFAFNMVIDPSYLNVQILPKWFKQQCQEKIEKYISTLSSYPEVVSLFESVINHLNGADLYSKESSTQFLNYIESLDKIRNTDFRKTFPELKDVFSHKK